VQSWIWSNWHVSAPNSPFYKTLTHMNSDNNNELFPIVDEDGNVLGKILRGEAHDGRKVLHPVVHLHLFNSKGELYLQRRPDWKPIQPGKWDTAVGGHISYGESVQEAFKREVMEELGISVPNPTPMGHYVFESKVEKELVYVFRTIYDGPVNPSQDELAGGRFWTMQEIKDALGKDILTPNFESEFLRLIGDGSVRVRDGSVREQNRP